MGINRWIIVIMVWATKEYNSFIRRLGGRFNEFAEEKEELRNLQFEWVVQKERHTESEIKVTVLTVSIRTILIFILCDKIKST